MNTLGAALLLGLIHTSIVALVTMLARLCVARRLSAARATIGVVGVACILAVTVLAVLPLPGVWPRTRGAVVLSHDLTDSTVEPGSSANESQDVAQSPTPTNGNSELQSDAKAQLPLLWLRRLEAGVERATIVVEAPSRGWRSLALLIAFGGSTISLIRLLLAVRSVRNLRRASPLVDNPLIINKVVELKRRCGCRREIEVRESPLIATAAAFGWRRPVILLPGDWAQWSAEELQAVLAHEVAHVERNDYVQRLVALIGSAFYFYHPLVRAGVRRLAIDQELAADRLARALGDDERIYARGLARLAMRYHDSLQDRRLWSSVSIMPRSSDFLARRLEMLRERNNGEKETGRTRWISLGVSTCLVMLALATALLRGAAADEKENQSTAVAAEVTKPIETARVTSATASSTDGKTAGEEQKLFRREAFDPSMVRPGSHGAFVIRLGEILRHPELQPHVDAMNASMTTLVHELIKGFDGVVDLRDIEWIAGDLIISVKGPEGKKETQSRLMMGSGGMVIRTSRPGVSVEAMAKGVEGSTIKEFEGKRYVQFPVLPAIGPVPVRMRFPDDKTIVMMLGTKEDMRPVDAEEKLLKRLFDDTPATHAWAEEWKAVDGGLITLVFDNSKAGWLELPKENQKYPPVVAPLFEKTRVVAIGLDWTEKSNRTGVRVRATCADRDEVKEIHLAAMTAVAYWPVFLLEGGETLTKFHKRVLQLFSTLKVTPSAAGGDEHYLDAAADVGWDPQEFIEILQWFWN